MKNKIVQTMLFANPKKRRNIALQAMRILQELIYHETHLTYRKSA